jgi:thymidylate synthase ThyX
MSPDRHVYLLDPQKLPPETIAVTFAKTSRSPLSFREIAAELTNEKSAEFHEKWVVGYGHASVAEHAVLHIAVENISRLAVECLESNRLASYTEKSTRYQKWGMDDFYIPEEIRGSLFLDDYLQTIHDLLSAYQNSIPLVKNIIADDHPRQEGETEAAWERRIRSDYIDVCRYFLPAACLANVGITINARALEHAITKMLSHPLPEVRSTGEEIKRVAREVVPTLVKYAEPSSYLVNAQKDLHLWGSQVKPQPETDDWCSCQLMDPQVDNRLLAALLFPHVSANIGYAHLFEHVSSLPLQDRIALSQTALASLRKFDIPARELEHSSFSFEIILDQGAYFELKRHRMMTQSVQPFSPDLGFAIPSAITRAGLETGFILAMHSAASAYHRLLSLSPHIAAYVLPNAFNRRVLITMNLRSAEHLVALRSAPNAHFSMRRVAQRLSDEMKVRAPILGQFLRTNSTETWQQIESHYFSFTNFSA